MIVKVREGRFYHWYEIRIVGNDVVSINEIGDESEKIRHNIDKKYFAVTNPIVKDKLQKRLCRMENCVNDVYMVGNEKKRTLSEVYSLGRRMDEPSLKRRAMDGRKSKNKSKNKDGCWKDFERVEGTPLYSKGSCRRKKKLFDGFDFKKIMREE